MFKLIKVCCVLNAGEFRKLGYKNNDLINYIFLGGLGQNPEIKKETEGGVELYSVSISVCSLPQNPGQNPDQKSGQKIRACLLAFKTPVYNPPTPEACVRGTRRARVLWTNQCTWNPGAGTWV